MAYEKKEYTQSDAVKQAQEKLDSLAALQPQSYQSQWKAQLDDTMGKILNREPFKYDLNGDALYQQYKDRYVNQGQQAMMDTMGQAAKLTGGYGNSYAHTVGQQAYQGYLQGLNDMIPQFQQMALDQYNLQGQDLYSRYGLLNTQEQADYDRWMNDYNRWLTERDFLAGRYDTERGYDYGVYRDSVTDDQWKAQFDEDIRRFNFANKLGEFAPVARSGGGGGGYSGVSGSGGGGGGDDETGKENWGAGQWEAYIGGIAEKSGSAAAGREMSAALKSGEMPREYAGLVQLATKKY